MLLRPASGGGGIRTLEAPKRRLAVFETAGMAENRLQIGTVGIPGERLRERNSSQTLEGTRHYRIARPAGREGRGGTRRNAQGIGPTKARLLANSPAESPRRGSSPLPRRRSRGPASRRTACPAGS